MTMIPLTEAAEAAGVHVSWMRKLCRERGAIRHEFRGRALYACREDAVAYAANRHEMPEELDDPEFLQEAYRRHGTVKAVAREIGSSATTVKARMDAFGIEASKHPRHRELKPDRARYPAVALLFAERGLTLDPEEMCPPGCPWWMGGGENTRDCLSMEGCPLLEEENS